MKVTKFEDIKAWQLARQLAKRVYALTHKAEFSKDFSLKNQIQAASGSTMHNIAEGFDSESNAEFIRFLRYSKRSCTEVQSELYLALDANYINEEEFREIYNHAGETRAAVKGFIDYLVKYKEKEKEKEV